VPTKDLLPRLQQHRDHHFRRLPHRRVVGEREALNFVEEVGFCTAFTPGLGVPCLREAIEGRREPKLPEHIQHDRAIMMTWRLKDDLPARGEVYYGKVLAGRPSFVSLELLPAMLRVRTAPVGYVTLYRRGLLSHCAKLVMDTLTKRGPAETKALKLSTGFAQPKMRRQFDSAMKELQEKFLALKIEERYDPFTYVWGTVEDRWADALKAARQLSPTEAAYRLARRYFEVAAFGRRQVVARILGIEPARLATATNRLVREGVLMDEQRITGLRTPVAMLRTFA
jgi:hypothetical protein